MAIRLTGKPQLNRFVNRRLILDRIRRSGKISRAELAKQTAIRPPTVSAVVKVLLAEGLVEEVGAGETSGGRAPRLLSLSRGRPRALGFEMSESSLLVALCDLYGDLCGHRQAAFCPMTPDEAVERLYEIGSEVLAEGGVSWSDLQGVGVAMPGHLNAETGHIRWSTTFKWQDVPFKRLCQARWSVTTDVVNDSSAGGMASQLFGEHNAASNLAFLYLRFQDDWHDVLGVGVGVIINGAPYHGEFGAAGEITLQVRHPLVHAARYGARYGSMAALVERLHAGEEAARAAIDAVADELSTLVIHIVNLLEPGVLVVGSDMSELRDLLLEPLRLFVDAHRLAFQAGQTQLVASSLGKFGVARGAIVPALQRLFRIPQWQ